MHKPRVVLAEYFATREHMLLFIAREDFSEPEVFKFPIPLVELRGLATQMFGTGAAIRRLDENKWHTQFRPLVEPILEWADEGDIIWFVPHDVLHHAPLHAVRIQGRYLVERNPVCYAPSASVMKYCQANRKGTRQHALVVGDPRHDLIHAREEAYAVSEQFGTEPLMGAAATKSRVKSILKQQGEQLDVLHFACHGKLNREQALASGITLAREKQAELERAGEESGILTAAEIFNLQLNADLVTLSACDSGVNERRPGDELIGLTRALIYAGTPSVLVSLWSVDDLSTRLLMEHFYEKLIEEPANEQPRRTKAQALRQAQQYVMNLTGDELVMICDERLARFEGADESERREHLEMDRVVARGLAGDSKHAIDKLQHLLDQSRSRADPRSERFANRAQRDLTPLQEIQPASRDPKRRPFSHLFHWAAFVLVGDWR